MDFELNLCYTMKDADKIGLLDQDELSELNSLIDSSLYNFPVEDRKGTKGSVISHNIQVKYLSDEEKHFQSRASIYILRLTMQARYKEKMPRTEGTECFPLSWWGKLQDKFDEKPFRISVSLNQAGWLVKTWRSDEVKDSWSTVLARWIIVFDDEIDRIAKLLEDEKSKVVIPDENLKS